MKENTMKLQLEQSEIEQAVREYVANQGIKVEGKTLGLKFSMTRGESGLIADLSIDDVSAAPVAASTKVGTRTPRAGTVGEAIVKQADKPAVATNVNKLPVLDETKAELETKPAEVVEETQTAAPEAEQPVAEPAPAVEETKPSTTTSLFG